MSKDRKRKGAKSTRCANYTDRNERRASSTHSFPRKSLGALYRASKSKPRSPDATGQLKLQRHTFEALMADFDENNCDEVVCDIAGWKNRDNEGRPYLTVELSPRFRARAAQKDDFDIF
jgi:hypothetical protein